MYGNHDTRFFVYWRANKKGCFNLLCEGFVPYKPSNYIPGHKLDPISQIDGKQSVLALQISKDSQTGDWWLNAVTNGAEPIGHWPKSLFTSLADSASIFQWGGAVSFYPNQKSPPMGSGRYPREGYGKAAYLRNVQLISDVGSISPTSAERFEDQTYCYQFVMM
ncbi:uncharacterized protein M6B38_196135 [Iris pallida]|uniref:Neprosin PEP catalytic domain-containing protein n=1 Tax=Iris pallida TaxID=29817 RepID=A0AAX6ECP8_IRIPA|nr:uncharacterized protein M6B38_196135 [Iris pallida]